MKKFTKTLGIMLAVMLCLTACGSPKHITEITGQEFKTLHDTSVVCVYSDYTNNSGETALPADWQNVRAFQNGVALSPVVYTGEKMGEYVQCDTAIQDGTTAKVVWVFYTDDTESEVTVEVSDL